MATYPKVRVAEGQLTAAQVNANSRAGTVIVPLSSARTLTVVDAWFRAIGGTAGGATAIVLEDTAGVDVVSTTAATLVQNSVIRAGTTGSTATNLGTSLTRGKGLRIGCTVSDMTTATHLDYCVQYTVEGN